MPQPRFFLANAFATQPHGGNQAAIVVLDAADARGSDDAWCRTLGRDFDMPMTAVITPTDQGAEPVYKMRWWTGAGQESPLCGHATIATSFVLFAKLHTSATTVHFDTVAGRLSATLVAGRGQGAEVAISLPLAGPSAPSARSGEFGALVASAAGLSAEDIVEVATYEDERSAIVRVKDTVPLQDLKVDTRQLYPTIDHKCVVTQVVGSSEHGVRINSRVFIEGLGISEDPVTGSAHSALAEYYLLGHASPVVKELVSDPKSATLDAQQVSERGGAMRVSVVDGRMRAVGRVWLWAEGSLADLEA